jgi:hypothetical protein
MKKYLFFTAILIISLSFKPNSDLVFDLHFEEGETLLSEKNYQQLDKTVRMALVAEYGCQIGLEVFPNSDEFMNEERLEEILTYLSDENIKVDKVLHYSDLKHLPDDVKLMKDLNFIRLTLEYKLPPIVSEITNQASKNEAQTPQKVTLKWAESVVNYKKNEEHFTASNFSIIKIETADGSFIKFEPESFVFENGDEVTSTILITTKYATTKDIAILEELTTISNGELLESQGMMYVNATSNGRQLRLKKGKSFTVNMKFKNAKEGFQGFNGQSNPENGQINWFLAEKNKVELKRTKEDYFYYKLIELTSSEKRELEVKRQEIIERWQKRGIPKKKIRERLKRYKQTINKRDTGIKKQRTKETRRPKDGRQPRVAQSHILGLTDYKYEKFDKQFDDTAANFAKMQSNTLGWMNIDKLLKEREKQPPCHLLVKADEKTNVKVVFNDYFSVFKGVLKDGVHVFPNFPSTLSVTIIAAEKLPGGKVRFAYEQTILEDKTVSLTNYQTVSEKEFIDFVRKLNS